MATSSFQKLFKTLGVATPTPAPVQRVTPTPTPQVNAPAPRATTPTPVSRQQAPVQQQRAPVTTPKIPNFTNIQDYTNNLAKQRGVAPKAPVFTPSQSTAQRPNTFLKGGSLSKFFDVLLTVPYAMAGAMKGARQKSEELGSKGGFKKYGLGGLVDIAKAGAANIVPGVQQRTMVSGQAGDYNFGQNMNADLKRKGVNVLDNKVAQEGLNIAGNFALPTPALPLKFLSKIPGIRQAASIFPKATNVLRRTPKINTAIEKVVPYFRNPAAGRIIKEGEEMSRNKVNALYARISSLSRGLTPEQQRLVGKALEGRVKRVPPELQRTVRQARLLTQQVGQAAVDAGLMKKETFNRMKDRYMSRVWNTAEKGEASWNTVRSGVEKISGKMFEKRKGKKGYIEEFAPALFKGLGMETQDVVAKNMYNKIIKDFGVRVNRAAKAPEGYKYARQAIDNSRIAKYFKGVALPNEVVDYLNKTLQTPSKGGLGYATDKVIDVWKQLVTIYNPAYHSRNIVSNQILSDMSTGDGITKTVKNFVKSTANTSGKGDQRFINAAKNAGLIGGEDITTGFKKLADKAGVEKIPAWKKILQSPRGFQKRTEEISKVQVFRSWVEKEAKNRGISIDTALKNNGIIKQAMNKAEEAIFSPYKIGAQERNMVKELGIPFYSFLRQAIPFTAKTAVKNPERIAKFGKARNSLESLSGERIPQNQMPVGTENLVKTPVQDDDGKNVYYDPTYTLPYGNISPGNVQSADLPLGVSFNPIIQEGASQMASKDVFTGREFGTSNIGSEALKDRIGHVINSFAPALPKNVINKIIPAIMGKEDYSGNKRSVSQALIETLLGIKTRNYSNEDIRDRFNKQTSSKLRSLQIEAGTNPERMEELKKLRSQTIKNAR